MVFSLLTRRLRALESSLSPGPLTNLVPVDEHYTPDEIREAVARNWDNPARWGARLLAVAGKRLGSRRHLIESAEGLVHEAIRKLLEPENKREVGYRNIKRRYTGPDAAERDRELYYGIIQAISSEVSNMATKAVANRADLSREPLTPEASPEAQLIEDEHWQQIYSAFEGDELVLQILQLRRQDPDLPPRDLAHLLHCPVDPDIYRAIERMKAGVRRLDRSTQ
ncbi:MAG: hypothetical protein AAGN64_03810 [Bacteroidota bacterium]